MNGNEINLLIELEFSGVWWRDELIGFLPSSINFSVMGMKEKWKIDWREEQHGEMEWRQFSLLSEEWMKQKNAANGMERCFLRH